MAARVIHFGPDDCHRLMVLQSAGYSVAGCNSLIQLSASLVTGADAVLMSEDEGGAPQDAVALARTQSSAPVVLFRTTNLSYEDSGFDLVVHSLTSPEVWLNEVDELIAKTRTLQAQSIALIEESRELRRDSAVAVDRSRAQRERSRQERARNGTPSRTF